ncbi:hypothetical protein FRC12_019285 [Ceratobasidium sp. 428]|nr:hypothetical protein FRC12_019285 [Ceratobasidium sp. 428]
MPPVTKPRPSSKRPGPIQPQLAAKRARSNLAGKGRATPKPPIIDASEGSDEETWEDESEGTNAGSGSGSDEEVDEHVDGKASKPAKDPQGTLSNLAPL